MFYKTIIESLWLQLVGSKHNKQEIEEKLVSIAKNIENLKHATMIYSVSSILVLEYTANSQNIDYINAIREDMVKNHRAFEDTLTKSITYYESEKTIIGGKLLLGYQMKQGKFDPDKFFNSQSVDEDKKVFCKPFMDSIDQMKARASSKTEYVVCGEELYMLTKNSN